MGCPILDFGRGSGLGRAPTAFRPAGVRRPRRASRSIPAPEEYDGSTGVAGVTIDRRRRIFHRPFGNDARMGSIRAALLRLKTRLDTRPKKPHGPNRPLPQPLPQLLNGPD